MIRFYNGRVLSFGGGVKISSDEVWIDGNKIVYVGAAKAPEKPFDEEIDLNGNLLMPGFKDAHTHTAMVFLRSLADELPLQDWLSTQVWPNEAKLDGEAVYNFTKLGIMEYLSSGITACYDMYVKLDDYVRANIDCGFRTVMCSGFNNFDADPDNIEREYLRYNGMHELISYTLGIHAEYTTSLERMKFMSGLVHKYKAPCFMHLSETKAEVDGCIERHGMTPPMLLDSLGMFDYGGGGYHCVWMSDDDIKLFAEKKLWAVTNPASNLKLASGIAPIVKMQQAGIPLAIGTDGAASNNALDMFREMYLTACLQKYLNRDAASCDADSVLEMACVGGARAMGLNDCDDIAVGKKADLIVIDMHRPNMQPVNNISRNLVYSGSKENVKLTMVNGRILYRDGKFFIGEEPESIFEKANRFLSEKIK